MTTPRSSAKPVTPSKLPDLRTRVETRKRELIGEIVEHKKTISRAGSVEAIDRLKARLLDLSHIMKVGVADGWANVGDGAKVQLNEWIAR
jgi:hypothetical protein